MRKLTLLEYKSNICYLTIIVVTVMTVETVVTVVTVNYAREKLFFKLPRRASDGKNVFSSTGNKISLLVY